MYISKISKVSGNADDLLFRLNTYGKGISTLSHNKLEYLIICTHDSPGEWNAEHKARYPFLKIVFIRRGFKGFFEFRKFLRKFWGSTGSKTTLIAGDPWWGFLFLLIIRATRAKYCSLQIQLHGDIYVRPNEFSPKAFIKFVYVRLALLVADTIRVVSEHQKQDLLDISNSLGGKICVSPIPVRIPDELVKRKSEKIIGIVGRLHVERGIQESVKILVATLQRCPEYRGLIIGDGPEWFTVENEIKKYSLTNRIKMTGWIDHSEVFDYLMKTEIIISSAPSEGYGLTIREAYLSGVSVLAFSNNGTRQANKDWKDSFNLYSSFDDAMTKIFLLLQTETNKDSFTHRNQIVEIQKRANSISIDSLVATWINT